MFSSDCTLFLCQEYDEETGLYNFRARLYDDELFRFYAIDPAGQQFSGYAFVGNSPLMYVDKNGKEFFSFLAIAKIVYTGYKIYQIANAIYSIGELAYQAYKTGDWGRFFLSLGKVGVYSIASGATSEIIEKMMDMPVVGKLAGAAGGSVVGTTMIGEKNYGQNLWGNMLNLGVESVGNHLSHDGKSLIEEERFEEQGPGKYQAVDQGADSYAINKDGSVDTPDELNPSTVRANYLWSTYNGQNNPMKFKIDSQGQALRYFGKIPGGLEADDIPALFHDVDYENNIGSASGVKALLLEKNVIKSDIRFVYRQMAVSGKTIFNNPVIGIRAAVMGIGLGVVASPKIAFFRYYSNPIYKRNY